MFFSVSSPVWGRQGEGEITGLKSGVLTCVMQGMSGWQKVSLFFSPRHGGKNMTQESRYPYKLINSLKSIPACLLIDLNVPTGISFLGAGMITVLIPLVYF